MYRIRQFMRGLASPLRGEDWELVEALLTRPQLELFRSMSQRDQRHGVDLVLALRRKDHEVPELMQAALLHDAGKARHLSLWYRVGIVLLQRFAPAVFHRLADERPGSVGYPFFAYLNHPGWGAERAAQVGSESLTVEIIRRHHERLSSVAPSEVDRLLAALQAADGQV